MKVRQLNNQGVASFETFLASLSTPSPYPVPRNLLTDESTSTPFIADVDVEAVSYTHLTLPTILLV